MTNSGQLISLRSDVSHCVLDWIPFLFTVWTLLIQEDRESEASVRQQSRGEWAGRGCTESPRMVSVYSIDFVRSCCAVYFFMPQYVCACLCVCLCAGAGAIYGVDSGCILES